MFGIDNDVGKTAAIAAIQQLDPVLRNALMVINAMAHSLLDRLDGTTINIQVKIPPPKAKAANPAPTEDKY